jgi:hypothetical protein
MRQPATANPRTAVAWWSTPRSRAVAGKNANSLETKRRQAFLARSNFLMPQRVSPQSLQSIMGAVLMRRSNSFIAKHFFVTVGVVETGPTIKPRSFPGSELVEFSAIGSIYCSDFAWKSGSQIHCSWYRIGTTNSAADQKFASISIPTMRGASRGP